MKQNSSITLSEFRELLQLPVCVQTIWNALRDWGIVLKKVLRAAERHRPDVLQKRRWWNILMLPRPVDRLVFIDETGASTKMARLDGWGPRSERVVADIPHGHWKTTTFVGALRSTGMTAPMVTADAMNGDLFLASVQQQLVPTLRRDDFVIMDNLNSHQKSGVREAIEAAGARLMSLPPDSPNLNPIELAFSKLKTLLRKFGERTVDALWTRIGHLMNEFTPTKCLNYFQHCEYAEDQ